MDRLELFNKALRLAKQKYEEHPDFFVLQSIIDQLLYLINILENKEKNLSFLNNMTIGRITAYDIDNFDEKLSSLLYEVCDEIHKMQNEYLRDSK